MAPSSTVRRPVSADGGPQSTPLIWARNPYEPWVRSWQFDESSSGAAAVQCCQASSIADAAGHGYCNVNNVSSGTGCSVNVNDVATP
jgi:hypothetical protein